MTDDREIRSEVLDGDTRRWSAERQRTAADERHGCFSFIGVTAFIGTVASINADWGVAAAAFSIALFLAILAVVVNFIVATASNASRNTDAASSDRVAMTVLERLRAGEPTPPFSVALRPFETETRFNVLDGRYIYGSSDPGYFELPLSFGSRASGVPQDLFELLAERSPRLVMVGQRTQADAPALAYLQSTDETWREDVALLLKHARIIFCAPWHSDGTRWEVVEVLTHYRAKTIFVMPPTARIEYVQTQIGRDLVSDSYRPTLPTVADENWWKASWEEATKPLSQASMAVPQFNYLGAFFFYDASGTMHHCPIPQGRQWRDFWRLREVRLGS